MNPNSRFQVVVGGPPLPPGNCFICTNHDPNISYIDVGVTVRRHGRLYFCKPCMVDCGSQLGLVDSTSVAEVAQELAETKVKLAELEKENDGLRSTLRSAFGDYDRNVSADKEPAKSDSPAPKKPVGRPRKADQQPSE